MIKFEIIGDPCGKGRHRASVVNGHIHTYTPEKTANYENLVKVMYLQQVGRKRLDGAIRAQITAYYKIPQSWSKKRIAEAIDGNTRPTVKVDCDNCAKIILDSLNGLAYDDDKQVVELIVKKYYSETAKVVVELEGV